MARKKNRPVAEVNSGSMADIAFLLLIFFLVTTTIANDKGITMLLPPKNDKEQDEEVKSKQRNIFKILANSRDQLLVEDEPLKDVGELKEMVKKFVLNFGKPDLEATELFNSFPSSLQNYVNQYGNDPESSDHPGKGIVSFKADRGTSYDLYIQVLDQVNMAYNEIYGERVGISPEEFLALDKKDPAKKEMYLRARKGIPRAISIAEPNKAGGAN